MTVMIKMIGLDLDGTLLTSEKSISPLTVRVLEEAMRRGIYVVPVTGRPVSGIPEAVLALKGLRYAITSNGASTFDLCSGSMLRRCHIPLSRAAHILSLTEQFTLVREVFIDGIGYETEADYRMLMHRFAGSPLGTYLQESRRAVDGSLMDFVQGMRRDVENIHFQCPSEEVHDAVLREIAPVPDIIIVENSPLDLELNDARADKGLALLELGNALGIPAEEIMAAGDNDNDFRMLSCVGVPVAMGNATQKILDCAKYVTATNDDEGVAKAVMRFTDIRGDSFLD